MSVTFVFKVKTSFLRLVVSYGYSPVKILETEGTVIGAGLMACSKNIPFSMSLSRLGVKEFFLE